MQIKAIRQPLKLNLGCGSDLAGYVNVDKHPASTDVVQAELPDGAVRGRRSR